MKARAAVFPQLFPDGVYPPNTLLVVSSLVRPELLVEIEAMAVRSGPTRRPAVTRKKADGRAPGRRARPRGRP
jgi:hypothetical protein